MKKPNAKELVIKLCYLLARIYPSLPDDAIQDLAIDLHDIGDSCSKIAKAIRVLYKDCVPETAVAEALNTVDGHLLCHIVPNHVPSFRRIRSKTKRADKKGSVLV